MRCPKCGEKTKVVDSRETPISVERMRRCKGCDRVFYTTERVVEYGRRGFYKAEQYTRARLLKEKEK